MQLLTVSFIEALVAMLSPSLLVVVVVVVVVGSGTNKHHTKERTAMSS